jgi:ABC-type branched-subunit amino acid transport system substrate-binding protein
LAREIIDEGVTYECNETQPDCGSGRRVTWRRPAQAQISDNVVKIGVLSDMSSLYTDLAGAGSVVAARMAVEDSGIEKRGVKVEFVSADHQNKPDVGSNIARQWYDVDKVDVIVDVPNSGVALAVNQITKDKGKAFSSPVQRPRTSPARRARQHDPLDI